MSFRSLLWKACKKMDFVEECDSAEDWLFEAEPGQKEKVLKVSETGCYIMQPDKVCVMASMRGREYVAGYKEASEMADRDTEKLLELLKELDIEKEQVESKELEIALAYKEEDEDEKVQGYTYRHFVDITIPANTKRLCKLVRTLMQSKFNFSLEYEYRVTDTEFARDEALADGARKSRRKAQMLANELGITLQGIRKVSYDGVHSDIDVIRGKRYLIPRMRDDKNCRLSDRITDISKYISKPFDVVFKEEVTVEWIVKDVVEE